VFAHGSGQVGFVVDKMALGQVFSKYFGFPCQSSFHQLLHNHPHHHLGLYNRPEVAAVPADVSPTPPNKTKNSCILDRIILCMKDILMEQDA
jgi:hypothetical protein